MRLFLLFCFLFLSTVIYSKRPVENLLQQNEEITEPYLVEVMGKPFWVYPQNFGSLTFPDTVVYAQNLPVKGGDKFLEMGCATGIISVAIALKTEALVTAIDINPYAVLNTIANADFHNVKDRIKALESDLFSELTGQDKFDIIFFNVPALDTKKKDLSYLEQAIYDPGYQILARYINEALLHLSVDGRLFVGYSPVYGNFAKFKELAERKVYTLKIIIQDQPYPQTIFELIEVIIPK